MTLTVEIKVPETAGSHEAEVTCSTDEYKDAVVLAPGDAITVHVHAANEVHIKEVPSGSKKTAQLPPHQKRVIEEKVELDLKLQKLSAFIDSEGFAVIVTDPAERERLVCQEETMRDYSGILGERIAAF